MSDKISYTIPEAVKATGFSRSRIYELIKRGDLKPRKAGRRTILLRNDLEAMVQNLPAAG